MKAFYPGSFDPFTVGHMAMVCEILNRYDGLVIGVGVNDDKEKPLFGQKYRVYLVEKALEDLHEAYNKRLINGRRFSQDEVDAIRMFNQVKVVSFSGMQIDAATRFGADVIIRGERDMKDHAAETALAMANETLSQVRKSNIRTVIIPVAEERFSHVSSSFVKGLCAKREYVAAASMLENTIYLAVLAKYLKKDYVSMFKAFGCDETDYAENSWFRLRLAYSRLGVYDLRYLAYALNYLQLIKNETQILSDADYLDLKAAVYYSYFDNETENWNISNSASLAEVLGLFAGAEAYRRVHNLVAAHRGVFMSKIDIPTQNLLDILHDVYRAIWADKINYGLYILMNRQENGLMSDVAYATKRIEEIEGILNSGKIFKLPFFVRFENYAVANLCQEKNLWQNGLKNA